MNQFPEMNIIRRNKDGRYYLTLDGVNFIPQNFKTYGGAYAAYRCHRAGEKVTEENLRRAKRGEFGQ